jgi:hypothetical protein
MKIPAAALIDYTASIVESDPKRLKEMGYD